jgi:Fe-S-cluster containining protein
MKAEMHRRALELYADVDAAVAAAGPNCESSGRCCRFKEWGHVLYLSALEAEVLLAAAPPYTKPVSPDFCPFQKENLCTAREPRPLGCRIYFCDPAYQETGNAIMEDALGRMKQLTTNADRQWRYAPLHVFLNEALCPSAPVRGTGTLSEKRISLPLTDEPDRRAGSVSDGA